MTKVTAYKAFDKDFKCRDFQYEVGKTYKHKGDIKICREGFHACSNPMDVWNYYDILDSRYGIVELSGDIQDEKSDSKLCSSKIKVIAEIKIFDIIKASVNWHFNGWFKDVNKDKKAVDSKNYSKLAASGDSSKLAASGDSSKLAASGDSSNLAASGNYSKLAASGNYSNLAASGDSSKLAASGYGSKLAASGGGNNVVVSAEKDVIVKGSLDTLICLTYYIDDEPIKFVTGKVGERGLKADTWYKLDINGRFMETEA
jgi:hypothetical protein